MLKIFKDIKIIKLNSYDEQKHKANIILSVPLCLVSKSSPPVCIIYITALKINDQKAFPVENFLESRKEAALIAKCYIMMLTGITLIN